MILLVAPPLLLAFVGALSVLYSNPATTAGQVLMVVGHVLMGGGVGVLLCSFVSIPIVLSLTDSQVVAGLIYLAAYFLGGVIGAGVGIFLSIRNLRDESTG